MGLLYSVASSNTNPIDGNDIYLSGGDFRIGGAILAAGIDGDRGSNEIFSSF